MSLTAIIGAITALASIITGIVYLFKQVKPSPQEEKQKIDDKVKTAIDSASQGGRPTDV